MPDLYFEDVRLGQRFETRSVTIDEDEIVRFGRRYARLPYHTDAAAAARSAFGGLVAPGYMTAALTFGLFTDAGVFRASGMGSPGVDELRWRKPVRPGDTLRVVAEIVELSPARSPGGRDAVRIRYQTFNQRDEVVMTLTSLHFIGRRPA